MSDDDRLFSALEFAVEAHAGHVRKGTQIPYVTHPIRVAATLAASGCDGDIVIAGYLHDTVEDTSVTLEQISDRFGSGVAALVAAASEPHRDDTWEERKSHTVAQLDIMPFDQLWVPLADKLDNITSIQHDLEIHGPAVWRRFKRSRKSQQWYYSSLVGALTKRAETQPTPSSFTVLLERLRRSVEEVFR